MVPQSDKSIPTEIMVIADTQLKIHSHIKNIVTTADDAATNSLQFMTSILTLEIHPILDFAAPVWNTNTGVLGNAKLLVCATSMI